MGTMKFARVTALTLTGWAAALLNVGLACAETIQLRDGMSVTGRILAEKKDQIVVDLGFTVLAVPRGDVIKVVKEAESESKSGKAPAIQEAKGGLYAVATTPPASTTVSPDCSCVRVNAVSWKSSLRVQMLSSPAS